MLWSIFYSMECSRPYGSGMGEAGCLEDKSPFICVYFQKELDGTVKRGDNESGEQEAICPLSIAVEYNPTIVEARAALGIEDHRKKS